MEKISNTRRPTRRHPELALLSIWQVLGSWGLLFFIFENDILPSQHYVNTFDSAFDIVLKHDRSVLPKPFFEFVRMST